MFSDGLQFGMEGPNMTGTWINPNTGHKFTVRDSFFENNEFKVMTTDGQLLDYNMLQHYIQCNDKNGQPIAPTNDIINMSKQEEVLPPEVMDMIEEDVQLTKGLTEPRSLGNINAPRAAEMSEEERMKNEDKVMINRVLRRSDSPEVVTGITWPNIPVKQLDTLINMLGVDVDDVVEHYINKVDTDAVVASIKEKMAEFIKGTLETGTINVPFCQTKAPLNEEVEMYAVSTEVVEKINPKKKTVAKKQTKKAKK